jgi:hypothetical protein
MSKTSTSQTSAPRIAKGAQPSFFDQPALEAMYGMLVVLMEEVCVLQDRLDTYERLGAKGIAITPEAVDAYDPDEAVESAREQRRHTVIRRIMRPIKQLQEAAVARSQARYEQDARQIAERDI